MSLANLPTLKIIAVLTAMVAASIPLASATSISILVSGRPQYEDIPFTPQSLLSSLPSSFTLDTSDPDNPQVRVTINSGNILYPLADVLLYTCTTATADETPANCVKNPAAFTSSGSMDVLIALTDITRSTGIGEYPKEGNLLVLSHLRNDPVDSDLWVGSWIHLEVTNTFGRLALTPSQFELDTITITADDASAASSIRNFIEANENAVLPANPDWISTIEFTGADGFDSLSASEASLLSTAPSFSTASSGNPVVSGIGTDYSFIFPEISGDFVAPATLFSNPSAVCGDGAVEPFAETRTTCCYDAGCGVAGDYCDVVDPIEDSLCRRSTDITATHVATNVPAVTSCSGPFTANITVQIANAPATLSPVLSGDLFLGDEFHDVECTGSRDSSYVCSVELAPAFSCGLSSSAIGPNTLNLMLEYQDGPNTVLQTATTAIPTFKVNYDCGCGDDLLYCDAVAHACKSESSIRVQAVSIPTPLQGFVNGQSITIPVQVSNPPSDLNPLSATVTFNFGSIETSDRVILNSTATPVTCPGGPGTNFLYTCSVPITVPNYDPSQTYYIRGNSLDFAAVYSDAGLTVNNDLTATFGDITIQSQICGNGVQDPGETSATCCLDVACTETGFYCDTNRLSCQPEGNIGLVVDAVLPVEAEDAQLAHPIDIDLTITNAPAGFGLDFWTYRQDNVIVGYDLDCGISNQNLGKVNCTLIIPPQDNCSLPGCVVGPNSLELTISYPNGDNEGTRTKLLNVSFSDITVVPVYHCGDGIQEPELGESVDNCCLDFSCSDAFGPDYFCSYDPVLLPSGFCQNQNDIHLVIDSPTTTVKFSNCEIDQTVQIVAHIENAPGGLLVEDVFGTLNNTAAELVSCAEQAGVANETSSRISYDCSLTVPAVDTCSQGQTFTYNGNSLSFAISFNNGLGLFETQTITASLPVIETTQSFRTLFDIGEALSAQITSLINEIKRIAENMLDTAETCVKLQKLAALIGVAAIISFSVLGLTGTVDFSTSRGSSAAGGAQAGATVATSLVSVVKAYCESALTYYDIQLKLANVKVTEAEVEACLAAQQHTLDTGFCEGQEITCFNSVQACIGQIRQITSQAGQISNLAKGLSDPWINAFKTVEEGIEKVSDALSGGGRTTAFSIKYNDHLLDELQCACNRGLPSTGYCPTGPTATVGQSRFVAGASDTIGFVISGADCPSPLVVETADNGIQREVCYGRTVSGWACNTKTILIDDITAKRTFTYTLYCYNSDEDVIKAVNEDRWKNRKPSMDPRTVKVGFDQQPYNCQCSDPGEGGDDAAFCPRGVPGTVVYTKQFDPEIEAIATKPIPSGGLQVEYTIDLDAPNSQVDSCTMDFQQPVTHIFQSHRVVKQGSGQTITDIYTYTTNPRDEILLMRLECEYIDRFAPDQPVASDEKYAIFSQNLLFNTLKEAEDYQGSPGSPGTPVSGAPLTGAQLDMVCGNIFSDPTPLCGQIGGRCMNVCYASRIAIATGTSTTAQYRLYTGACTDRSADNTWLCAVPATAPAPPLPSGVQEIDSTGLQSRCAAAANPAPACDFGGAGRCMNICYTNPVSADGFDVYDGKCPGYPDYVKCSVEK